MAGIFDFFKPQTDNNQGNNTNGNPNGANGNSNQNGNTGNGSPIPNSGIAQNGSAQENNNGGENNSVTIPKNPLDAFKGLFDNTGKETKAPPAFSLPKDKLGEVSNSLSFTSSVPKELMEKALGGDASAMMEAMQYVGRAAYENSMNHQSHLTDAFMTSRLGYENDQLGSRVKEQLTTSELSSNTTNFNHPVVKAQLTAVAKDLARQHPDASPQEVAKMAKNYVIELANAINPQGNNSGTQANGQPSGEVDWDKYFQ